MNIGSLSSGFISSTIILGAVLPVTGIVPVFSAGVLIIGLGCVMVGAPSLNES
jgi:hypothetical protein